MAIHGGQAPSDPFLEGVASWLKALADPTRLRILHALQGGERCVSDLLAGLPCTQANVSKHLAILRAAGIVTSHRDGANVRYAIADPAVFSICDTVCSSIERELDAKRKVLAGGRAAGARRAPRGRPPRAR